jgi:hypothetical protein
MKSKKAMSEYMKFAANSVEALGKDNLHRSIGLLRAGDIYDTNKYQGWS